jgi:hypothetical protein
MAVYRSTAIAQHATVGGCTVDVAPLTAEELQSRLDSQWQVIRNQRNQLLKDSDWTQLADTPVDKATWATYRQALRDITVQTDPYQITWPVIPL